MARMRASSAANSGVCRSCRERGGRSRYIDLGAAGQAQAHPGETTRNAFAYVFAGRATDASSPQAVLTESGADPECCTSVRREEIIRWCDRVDGSWFQAGPRAFASCSFQAKPLEEPVAWAWSDRDEHAELNCGGDERTAERSSSSTSQ